MSSSSSSSSSSAAVAVLYPSSAASSSSSSSTSTSSSAPLVLGIYDQLDAAILSAAVAAQIDERFISMDLRSGSRIIWSRVRADMRKGTGKEWSESACQRLWRFVAYGDDIGPRDDLLPDSDGEDGPLPPLPHPTTQDQLNLLPVPAGAQAVELLNSLFSSSVASASTLPENASSSSPSTTTTTTTTSSSSQQQQLLTSSEVAAIDAFVKNALGPAPEPRRNAFTLFLEHYKPEARKLRVERMEAAKASMLKCQQALGRLTPRDLPALGVSLREQLQQFQLTLETESNKTSTNLLKEIWTSKTSAVGKEEWNLRATEDARRAEEQQRLYGERQAALYRLVEHQYRLKKAGARTSMMHRHQGFKATTATATTSSTSSTSTSYNATNSSNSNSKQGNSSSSSSSSSSQSQSPAVIADSTVSAAGGHLSKQTLLTASVSRPQAKIIAPAAEESSTTEDEMTTQNNSFTLGSVFTTQRSSSSVTIPLAPSSTSSSSSAPLLNNFPNTINTMHEDEGEMDLSLSSSSSSSSGAAVGLPLFSEEASSFSISSAQTRIPTANDDDITDLGMALEDSLGQ